MPFRRQILFAFLGALLLPAPTQAQDQGAWAVTPQVGMFFSALDLGPIASVSEGLYLSAGKLRPTPSLGLTIRIPLPAERLTLALQGMMALSGNATGSFDCRGTGTGIRKPAFSEASAWFAGADIHLHPFAVEGSPRPYLLAGAGIRQTRVSWPGSERYRFEAGEHTETHGGLHFGMGVDLETRLGSLRLEAGSYRTLRSGRVPRVPGDEGRTIARTNQHDFNLILGWTAFRF